jgi:hypothetical protein
MPFSLSPRQLDSPPIIMGQSFDRLVTWILLDGGLGAVVWRSIPRWSTAS